MGEAIVRYGEELGHNSWARWMVGRTMRKNQNNLVAVVGKTGSGKTWSAISICEVMSKMDGVPFTVDHIVFTLTELMELINSGKLRKGSKIIFDEPQVSISAREFQSIANKVFNYLLSTFRHRNLTLLFCAPFETLLDKNTRKLFHIRMETMSINRNTKTCRLKPRYIEYSDHKPLPYRKRLIVMFQNKGGKHGVKKLSHWDVPKPSPGLVKEYEAKKMAFTTNLNKNIEAKLRRFDDSGKGLTGEVKVLRKPLTEKQEAVMKVLANLKVSNKVVRAGEILGVNKSVISEQKKCAWKKGYTLEEFKENKQ